jgi:hypothetical protein
VLTHDRQAVYIGGTMTKKFITTGAFPEPEWTQVPNKFFDMLPEMEASEALTTLVLIRETYGYHRPTCKMSIPKIAAAAGISEGSVKAGAEAAEKRGTFRRSNPNEKTSAEWELVTGSTIDPSTIEGGEGQPLTLTGSTIDPQLPIKEIKENNKDTSFFTPKEQEQNEAKMQALLSAGQNPTLLREKPAIDAFESAFGITRPWAWYPAKTTDERTWKDLRGYLVELYEADPDCFTKYVTWTRVPYAKGTMTALGIKRNPQDFPDSWSCFLVSSSMYGKTETAAKVYKPEPEKKVYIPAPERK